MKKIVKYNTLRMIVKIKNHNKIYTLGILWLLWLIYIVNFFADTDMALIMFFIGFCLALLGGAYITDKPNKKEQKMMDKWLDSFKDSE